RFYPTPGKTHFVRIVLLDEQYVGSVQSSNGGSINVNDKVTLQFPADGVVTKSGKAYSGEVRVTAQPIPADDEKLSDKMPGALVGINEANEKGALGSLGMVTVELTSPSGDELQLKNGTTVEMKMKVPDTKIGNAPATIPMWYFDETAGYWKQDGTATLIGNEYVAQLPHFTFWNCDAWFDLVKFGATFVYENGQPASQINVFLTILSLNAGSSGITNADGFVCGSVPANEVMLMEVRSPCGEVIYSQQIGPYTDTTMIGPITIPSTSFTYSTISGNAVDCNGNAVTDGFVKIMVGNNHYLANIYEPDGAFAVTLINCNDDPYVITAYDEVNLKQSLPLTFPNAPVIDAGTITVCEDLTEIVDLEAVGLPDHVIFHFPDMYINTGNTTLYSSDSTSNGQYFYVRFAGTTEGTYAATGEIGFQLPNGDRAVAAGLNVVITHYGAVGDYITGTITGT
ncbi:MAG TPA: hypothetical protein VJ508_06415, partial [Saprospiraceae bacterium]|nr:hypothetical protein [Saprospiraceae bacterium]